MHAPERLSRRYYQYGGVLYCNDISCVGVCTPLAVMSDYVSCDARGNETVEYRECFDRVIWKKIAYGITFINYYHCHAVCSGCICTIVWTDVVALLNHWSRGSQSVSHYWVCTWGNTWYNDRLAHICFSKMGHNYFKYWRVLCFAPVHYLKQCKICVNWIIRNKFQWNLKYNASFKKTWKRRWQNIGHFVSASMCHKIRKSV